MIASYNAQERYKGAVFETADSPFLIDWSAFLRLPWGMIVDLCSVFLGVFVRDLGEVNRL